MGCLCHRLYQTALYIFLPPWSCFGSSKFLALSHQPCPAKFQARLTEKSPETSRPGFSKDILFTLPFPPSANFPKHKPSGTKQLSLNQQKGRRNQRNDCSPALPRSPRYTRAESKLIIIISPALAAPPSATFCFACSIVNM